VKRRPRLWVAAAALLVGAALAEPLVSPLNNEDVPRLLAHGPWPPSALRDWPLPPGTARAAGRGAGGCSGFG